MQTAVLSVAVPEVRRGREVALLAEHEARAIGYGFVDAEHLLLAAVALCAGMPRFGAVLADHGLSVDAVRCAARAIVGPPPGDRHEDRISCTPAVARILAHAAQIAGPHERVRPHHVLLAVLDGVDDPLLGGAHEVLEAVGADPRRLRRALRRAGRRA